MTHTPPYLSHVYRQQPSHFVSAIDIAACYFECQGKFLFLKRSLGKPQEHTWGVPAGKFEKGEIPLEAVLRETQEETHVKLDEKTLDDLGRVFVRYPHLDFTYHMFHQEFTDFPEIKLSDEHEEYRWVTFKEALELPLISAGKESLFHLRALGKKTTILRKDFYFIRHGETDVNADPNHKRSDYDLPLNSKGRKQAQSLHPLIKELNLSVVCTSPIQRAQETKNIATNGLAVKHFEEEGLSECKAAVWNAMVTLEEGRDIQYSDDVDGFFSRVLAGLNRSLEKDDPMLIVAHGGIHWAMCYHMMIENHPWKVGNCQLVHFSPRGDHAWTAQQLS